ncbi:hypothetical protein MRB53_004107 [Persea americana]|uniref:Uncharacterized protein n=1 Tax=Persea americana TaxID=3435 RepID=A0ACC2MZL7_PERAE|nr:hypothetical protein MRB53_004107 [Persea americana]
MHRKYTKCSSKTLPLHIPCPISPCSLDALIYSTPIVTSPWLQPDPNRHRSLLDDRFQFRNQWALHNHLPRPPDLKQRLRRISASPPRRD